MKKGFKVLALLVLLLSACIFAASAEEPVVTLENFKVPGYMDRWSGKKLSGSIHSTEPFTGVHVYVVNERSMKIEAEVSKKFDEAVTDFDATRFLGGLNLSPLVSGEKTLYIDLTINGEEYTGATYQFYVRGSYGDPASMTSLCKIENSKGAKQERLVNNIYYDGWKNKDGNDFLTITLPEETAAEAMVCKWEYPPQAYMLQMYDAEGVLLNEVNYQNRSGFWNVYHELPGGTQTVKLTIQEGTLLSELRVYEKDKVPSVVQRWEEWPEDMDLILVGAHKNDETLYFSGSLPLCIVEGREAGLVVLTECATRKGQEELFECMWMIGMKYHPIILRKQDGRIPVEECKETWGGYDNVCGELVEIFRRYTPEVVLTHDIKGEFGHPQHILTCDLVIEAISNRTWDENWYADSAAEFGVWDVPKLYIHMYGQDIRLNLPFFEPLEFYGGRTAMDVAYGAFDKYQSELGKPSYSLNEDGKKYDKTFFGLYRSTVGEDVLRNSFFENID